MQGLSSFLTQVTCVRMLSTTQLVQRGGGRLALCDPVVTVQCSACYGPRRDEARPSSFQLSGPPFRFTAPALM